jgi:hypothetical protein
MTANVTCDRRAHRRPQVNDAAVQPPEDPRLDPTGGAGGLAAWTDAQGRPEPRPLTLGIADDTYTEVPGDLRLGKGHRDARRLHAPAPPPGFGPPV